jgi:hypothetical protein
MTNAVFTALSAICGDIRFTHEPLDRAPCGLHFPRNSLPIVFDLIVTGGRL